MFLSIMVSSLILGLVGLAITGSWGVLLAVMGACFIATPVIGLTLMCIARGDPDRIRWLSKHYAVQLVGHAFIPFVAWLLSPADHPLTVPLLLSGFALLNLAIALSKAAKKAVS